MRRFLAAVAPAGGDVLVFDTETRRIRLQDPSPDHPAVIRITRRFHFSASHRYWVASWSDEENRRRFGKNVAVHGHNYILAVTLSGPIDPRTGMIHNLQDVKHSVGELLDRYYDHKNLNVDHPAFRENQPTTERIAVQLAEEIAPRIPPPAYLQRVALFETDDLYAEVILQP